MQLRPFQRDMAIRVADHDIGLFFVPIGAGKTAAILCGLYAKDVVSPRTLVVAPKEVARSTWPAEAGLWAPYICVRTNVEQPPIPRSQNVQDRSIDLLTMNYEQLDWLMKTFTSAKLRKLFDVVVFDEIDKMKAHDSNRFKKWKGRLTDFPRRYGMTATPASESLLGLWAETFCVDGGKTFGPSFARWRDVFFDSDYMGWVYTPKPNAEEAIYKALDPIVYRISAEQANVQLPALVECPILLDMEYEQTKLYDKLEKDLIAQVRAGQVVADDEQDVEVIEAESRAVLSNKLRQVVSGFAYRSDREQVPIRLSERKRDALTEHLEALKHSGEQCLIAYWWRDELEWLRALGVPALKDDHEYIRRWNEGEIRTMAIHPASAGHGLNLQLSKCEHLWFMTLPWSLGLYEQTVGRLRRSGGAANVRVHTPIMRGTVDETVASALKEKRGVQEAFLRRFAWRDHSKR